MKTNKTAKTNKTNNTAKKLGYWDELDRIERHIEGVSYDPKFGERYSERDPKLTPRQQIRKWLDEDLEKAKKNA